MGSKDPGDTVREPRLGDTVVYRRSRMGYLDLVVALGASAFVVSILILSIGLLASGEPAALGFLLIAGAMSAYLVPGSLLGLARVMRDGTILTLTPDGLVLHGVGYIPWTDVDHMDIEDQMPLVQERGTRVVGSMRQIAIHLRPGADAPAETDLDRAYRRIARGYLALGERAGRGRFHWLGVKEREVAGRLEDILDVATMYHAAVVGLDRYATDAKADPHGPAVSSAGSVEAVGDPELATEARRVSKAAHRDKRSVDDPAPRGRRVAVGLGIVVAVGVISWSLGRTLFGVRPSGALPPWPFIAFALLAGGLRFGHMRAAREGSWTRRAFAASVPVAIAAFLAGVVSASMAAGTFGTTARGSDPSAQPSAVGSAASVRPVARAAMALPEHPAIDAIDGHESTTWNAGAGPPNWILVDLGTDRSLIGVRLLVEQTPPGRTVHRILVNGDIGGEFERIHTFDGRTASGQWLVFRPDPPIPRVRRVVIETVEGPSWVAWREIVIDHD